MDRFIQKDHLFKRSILLVKAWCYYESRILGAHHGLISTYALETLVLYIFNVFHSNLRGPLEVKQAFHATMKCFKLSMRLPSVLNICHKLFFASGLVHIPGLF